MTSFFTGVAGDRLAFRCLAGHAVTLTVEAAVQAAADARAQRPVGGDEGGGEELEFGRGDEEEEAEEDSGYY
ncbi:MAG TPA: hypothetical protein VJ547_09360 [Candidatus Thermoplasmatota archaeon]|nr:hypothetical protein [Candidatus Thermoplasmatota archaeon]